MTNTNLFGEVRHAETPMPSGGEVPRDPVGPETIDNVSGGTQGLGQITDGSECAAESESTEMDL